MFNRIEKIKNLEEKADMIEEMAENLFNNAPLIQYRKFSMVGFDKNNLPNDLVQLQKELISLYNTWFTHSKELIKENIPDRLDEFNMYYNNGGKGDGVINILQLEVSMMLDGKDKILGAFRRKFSTQMSIVKSTEGLGISKTDNDSYLHNLLSRFHIFAKQFERNPHNNKSSFSSLNLKINNEYDIQHLLHAILKLKYDDVRPEEFTPSYAGSSTKMDFLLKTYKIVIETKMASEKLKDKDIGKQLKDDIAHYSAHQDCKILYCYVYDPDNQIKNPEGLIKDLSEDDENFKVIIIISSK